MCRTKACLAIMLKGMHEHVIAPIPLRVGTRRGALATRQSRLVIDALERAFPALSCTLVPIVTEGDHRMSEDLRVIGGRGVFVKEIEYRLLDRSIDIAVHSFKDMAPTLPAGLTVGCVPHRDSPFDCLVTPERINSIEELPQGARIGTNSLRRQSQLLHLRHNLTIEPIRGNVETRLRTLGTKHLDGVVLAEAGLNRLDLPPERLLKSWQLHTLSLKGIMLPAAAQGSMLVECRADDQRTLAVLAQINDGQSRRESLIERSFMSALGGNCALPLGAYARANGSIMQFDGIVLDADGTRTVTVHRTCPCDAQDVAQIGRQAAEDAIALGALSLISKRPAHKEA